MKSNCAILISACYSILGFEMYEAGILDDDWAVKKKLPEADTEDKMLIEVWNGIVGILWGSSIHSIRSEAKKFNDLVKKIPEEGEEGNHLLTSLYLFDIWVDTCADFITRAKWQTKLKRIMPAITMRVCEFRPELASVSKAAADNIYRSMIGKPVISAEIRQAKSRYVLNKLKNRKKR